MNINCRLRHIQAIYVENVHKPGIYSITKNNGHKNPQVKQEIENTLNHFVVNEIEEDLFLRFEISE